MPLALPDEDEHPLAVDVRDLQTDRLRDPEAGAVARHEEGPVLDVADAVEEVQDLLAGQDSGDVVFGARVRDVLDGPGSSQRDLVEKPEGADELAEGGVRDVDFRHQVYEEGANLLGAEVLGRAAVELR